MPTPAPGSGPGYFFKGISYLPDPAIRLFVLIPLTVNILVFGFLIYFGLQQMGVLMEQLLNWLPDWLSFLEFLLWPLLFLAMLGVVFFTFTIVGNFIAAPFNGLLAEKVQNLHGKTDLPEYELKDWLTLLPRAIGREVRKLIYYLPKAVVLLILSFIPVVNLVTPVLWFLFNSWMMSIQYCDYAADNRGVSFNDMLERLKQDRNYVWGFGTAVTLFMLIPFINLLIMPAAVVGSTLLWEDRIE
ncbi:sulfate transporter CysZ [Endozoicomonas sp. 8E]|uniref:sulfate transporter CysZ n=1 Tax=Endozoicomonas sp. 8E TaxID=3035692 RepID=UPI002939549C|nr:sulfate transporter CysZ [Endozoicomonas sp. 8E]WOG26382.1 sulfate transporter CysZ [Endozoicomonas sp. 8E]